MNKLQKLKEKIIEAVPEIMELKFGCEVEFADIGMWGHEANRYIWLINDERNNDKGDVLDKIWSCTNRGWWHSQYQGWKPEKGYPKQAEIYEYVNGEIKTSVGYSDKIKILGRPITLEDVLITLDKTNNRNYRKEIVNIWRFNKPLPEQPKETIDFLYNLICK